MPNIDFEHLHDLQADWQVTLLMLHIQLPQLLPLDLLALLFMLRLLVLHFLDQRRLLRRRTPRSLRSPP